jgi:hypothetical protein
MRNSMLVLISKSYTIRLYLRIYPCGLVREMRLKPSIYVSVAPKQDRPLLQRCYIVLQDGKVPHNGNRCYRYFVLPLYFRVTN